jgi:hypothetical protein
VTARLSRQYLLYHASRQHARQPLIQSLVEIRQPTMIQAHQMEDGGVQIGDVRSVFDGIEAEFVGGADGLATLDSGAGEPHGKAEGIVIAAGAIQALAGRRAPELAAPDQ